MESFIKNCTTIYYAALLLHSSNRFKSFCNSMLSLKVVIVLRHLVLSVNRNSKEDRMCSGKSLMYIKIIKVLKYYLAELLIKLVSSQNICC